MKIRFILVRVSAAFEINSEIVDRICVSREIFHDCILIHETFRGAGRTKKLLLLAEPTRWHWKDENYVVPGRDVRCTVYGL